MFLAQVAPVGSGAVFTIGGIELSPAEIKFILSLVVAVIGWAYAYAVRRGWIQETKKTDAMIHGIEAGVAAVERGDAPVDAVKTAVRKAATDAGVEGALNARVETLYPSKPGGG